MEDGILAQIESFQYQIKHEFDLEKEENLQIEFYNYLLEQTDFIQNNEDLQFHLVKKAYNILYNCDNESLKEKILDFVSLHKKDKIIIKILNSKMKQLEISDSNRLSVIRLIFVIFHYNIDFVKRYSQLQQLLVSKSTQFINELEDPKYDSFNSLRLLINNVLLECEE
jgi:hypothetical protein